MFVKSFGHVFSNLPLFSSLNPICSTQHVVKNNLLDLPKNQIQRVLLHISLVSQLTSHSLNKHCWVMILLMEEILHNLECMNLVEQGITHILTA